MNKIVKTLMTLTAASLLFTACEPPKEEQDAAKKVETKVSTIEEIQKQNGKPAKVTKAAQAKLNDVRRFSGTIEGMQQSYALSKMSDPLEKIHVQVGSTVKKDQVLAEYLTTADNTTLQQTKDQVELLEKATERMREVYKKGGITQQAMDNQELQLKIAKMGLETVKRANKILAPASGVVTTMNYQVGQTPGIGVFCTIAKLDKVILKLNITSQDVTLFKKGATATIDLNGETFKGKVTTIPLAANSITHSFPVEVTFDNKNRKLLPGMFVNAQIDARQVSGIVVPNEAIVYRNGVNYIWIVDSEGKAARKVVKMGVQTQHEAQILEGINEGDVVMVEGQFKMNEGDKVLVVE